MRLGLWDGLGGRGRGGDVELGDLALRRTHSGPEFRNTGSSL